MALQEKPWLSRGRIVLIGVVVVLIAAIAIGIIVASAKSSPRTTVVPTGAGGSTPSERQFCSNLQDINRAVGRLRSGVIARRVSTINEANRSLSDGLRNIDGSDLAVSQDDLSRLRAQAVTLQAAVQAFSPRFSSDPTSEVLTPLDQTQGTIRQVQASTSFCKS